jgi:hypothetical protein
VNAEAPAFEELVAAGPELLDDEPGKAGFVIVPDDMLEGVLDNADEMVDWVVDAFYGEPYQFGSCLVLRVCHFTPGAGEKTCFEV